jgi:hypothetical protein
MPHTERDLGRLAGVAAVVVATGFALWAFVVPLPVVADDSLFYVEIGSRMAAGEGSTFSGLLPTNGYQPLWQWTVAGLHATPAGDLGQDGRLVAVLVLWSALVVVGVVLLARLARSIGATAVGAVAGVTPVLLAFALFNLWGSEAAVNLVAIVVAAIALRRVIEDPSRRAAAVLGLALGVTVLARLDNAALVAAVVLVAGWGERRVPRRHLALTVGVAAAAVAPFLVWNQIAFGRPDTVASAIKSDLGAPSLRWGALPAFGWAVIAATVMAGLAWLAARRWAGLRLGADRGRVLAALALASAVHVGVYAVFATASRTHWAWYFVLQLVTLALLVATAWSPLLAALAARPPSAARRAIVGLTWLVVAAVVVLPVLNAVAARQRSTDGVDAIDAAAGHLADVLPEDDAVLALDLPGAFAFRRTGPVVAFDGLTGDFDYQEDLAERGIACTMEDLGIDVVVSPDYLSWAPSIATPGYGRAEVVLDRWIDDRPVGSVEVAEVDEVVRSADGEVVAWRVDWTCD